jgi:protein ImuB
MAASKAQALIAGLVIHDADPVADAKALDQLALWALQRYAPVVAADPPDGLVIDTTGTDHLHGGEQAMLAAMIERLAGSGITATAAVADTWGAAHAYARYVADPTALVPPGTVSKAMLKLPVAALRLPGDIVAALRVLGFTRVEELAAQPRAPLALRFGPELGRRLDQAFGRVGEPIDPIRLPDIPEVRRSFMEPISAAETIARYIGKLVVELCTRLEERGVGARRLDLLVHLVDGQRQAVRVGTGKPVRDAKLLTRMLCEKIETIDPGFGIEVMILAAIMTEPLVPRQSVSSLIETPEADVSDLIDLLANRVGEEHLFSFAPVASDVPERSVQRVKPGTRGTETAWPGHWPRPSRLLARPQAIEAVALLPDHPPVAFTWRGIRRRVVRADGPERIFGEWWRRDAEMVAVRDYFQVEDEAGERYWIFRAGDGEHADSGSHNWFMHGLFG